jgi:hypothetical protein
MSIQKILEQKIWDASTEDCEAVKFMQGLTFTPLRYDLRSGNWERLEGKFKFLKLRAVTDAREYGVFKCGRWVADFWHNVEDGYWFAVENPLICLEPDFDWSDDADWNDLNRLGVEHEQASAD